MKTSYTQTADDDLGSEPEPDNTGLVNRVFNYHTLSSLLRVLGSGVLVASLSILLFQGWDASSDVSRYYTLLAFSSILAVIGFVIGKVVRENKGARTFLALAVGGATVNYTVLGALAFSIYNVGGTEYPMFAMWVAPSGFAVVAAIASALLVLTPVIYLGFSVFARQSAKRFTVLYVACNLALVVPFRSSVLIGIIGIAMVVLILKQIMLARRTDSALATREGHLVIGAQFLPLLVLLGRNFYLYTPDEFMLTMGALIVYIVLRQIATSAAKAGDKINLLLEALQTMSAFIVALGVAAIVIASGINDSLVIPAIAVVFAGLLADMSLASREHAGNFRRAAAIVFGGGLGLNLFVDPSLTTALVSIASGLIVTTYGYSVEQKSIFVTGLFGLLSGLAYQLQDVARLFDIGNWSGLALVGIGAIVLASLLERYGLAIRSRALAWRSTFSAWDY